MVEGLEEAVREASSGVLIKVWVVPGSRVGDATGLVGGHIRLRVRSRPEGGKGNREVLKVLGELLGVAPQDFEIVRGHTSRRKWVLAWGLRRGEVLQGVRTLLGG